MAKNNVPIQETYEIPSRGKIYGTSMVVPERITLRAMTALDEKLRLSSNNPFISVSKLVNNCMVDCDQVDAARLKFFDLHFLMFKLRILTYGPEYRIKITCPSCGDRHDVTINLDELKCEYAPDDLVEPMDIKLPVSGTTVGVKFMEANDYLNISAEAQRIRTKFPDYEGDPEYIPSYMCKIVTVNGEELVPSKKQEFIENMHAKDLRVFDEKYAELTGKLGLDLGQVDVCPKCGHVLEYDVPMVREFFRPTY